MATSVSGRFAVTKQGGPDPVVQGQAAFESMKPGLTRKRKRRMPVIVFHGTTDVFPKDIEEIIVQHAAVREAPVFGIPNEKCGETRSRP